MKLIDVGFIATNFVENKAIVSRTFQAGNIRYIAQNDDLITVTSYLAQRFIIDVVNE